MQVITTIDELDAKIRSCDTAQSDAELHAIFSQFRMAPAGAKTDEDPFSTEYREAQMSLYEMIAGKKYTLSNEATPFDVDQCAVRPFPYFTGNPGVIGNQYMAIGALLRRLRVPSNGRILEFGPGWGNTTLALAMSGYAVTAVDIGANYCELIRRRAARASVEIDVVNGDFMWAEQVSVPYDAVVFFECFHHCDDHMRLLRALRRAVAPEGRLYFCGEPITDSFPSPWGLRLDGESLWAIRKHGWLELGFTEKYFVEALARTGWSVTKHPSYDHFAANVWEAVKIEARTGEDKPGGPQPLPEAPSSPTSKSTLHPSLAALRESAFWQTIAPIRAAVRAVIGPRR